METVVICGLGVIVLLLVLGWLFGENAGPQAPRRVLPEIPVGKVQTHTYQRVSGGYCHSCLAWDTMEKHIEKMIAEGWEPLTSTSDTTASYGLAKGLVGGALLGPLGLLAGKGGKKEATITINFIKRQVRTVV